MRLFLHICAFSSALIGATAGSLGKQLGLGMPHAHSADLVHAHDVSGASFGSEWERVYSKYASLPKGAVKLEQEGWTKSNSDCHPTLGYAWTQNKRGLTKGEPLVLYTTASGQPAGVGTVIRGEMTGQSRKWATTTEKIVKYKDSGIVFYIDIAFRSSGVCDKQASHDGIGDVLIVNPGGGQNSKQVPLTASQAQAEGWERGSCYDGMGTHYFLNTAGDSMSNGKSADLFPIVPMFIGPPGDEKLNAIFFASVTKQITFPFVAANWWEPITLSNDAFCGNHCGACSFTDNDEGEWSTMHIYFNDHTTVSCPADLDCSWSPINPRTKCCPAEAQNMNLAPGQESSQGSLGQKTQDGGKSWPVLPLSMGLLGCLGFLLAASTTLSIVLRRRQRLGEAREVRGSEMTSADAPDAA